MYDGLPNSFIIHTPSIFYIPMSLSRYEWNTQIIVHVLIRATPLVYLIPILVCGILIACGHRAYSLETSACFILFVARC